MNNYYKNATVFFEDVFNACTKHAMKRESDLEWCSIEMALLAEMETMAKELNIPLYDYSNETETEAIEHYLLVFKGMV